MSLRILVLLALLQLALPVRAFGQTPPVPPSLDQLSQSDRLSLLLAGLRQHDGALRSARYTFSYTATNTLDGRELVEHSEVQLIMDEERYRCEIRTAVEGHGDAVPLASQTVRMAWDGKRATKWSMSSDRKPTGVIADRHLDEDPIAPVWWFTDQVGVRQQGATARSVADWISLMVDERRLKWDVALAMVGPDPILKLTLLSPSRNRYEYDVNVGKGFLIQRYLFAIPRPSGDVTRFYEALTEDTRKFGPVWVPTRVTRSHYGDDGNSRNAKYVYELTDCTQGDLKQADLSLSFEPNTVVIDDERHESYTVQKDGSHVSLPLLNPKTGKVTGGSTSAPTSGPANRLGPRD